MSDCEMQRIDKLMIASLCSFLEAISGELSIGQKRQKKRFIGQSQQNCFIQLIEAIIFGR
jgi:hypothetical protein